MESDILRQHSLALSHWPPKNLQTPHWWPRRKKPSNSTSSCLATRKLDHNPQTISCRHLYSLLLPFEKQMFHLFLGLLHWPKGIDDLSSLWRPHHKVVHQNIVWLDVRNYPFLFPIWDWSHLSLVWVGERFPWWATGNSMSTTRSQIELFQIYEVSSRLIKIL